MVPTKRTSWKIWTIGAATLAALFFASSATANHRHHHSHRGEIINTHLDFLAAVAALSGEPYLAAALDHQGDLIEHVVDGKDRHRNHDSNRWRKRDLRRHRHFDGCGHGIRKHRSKHGRHSWRASNHDRHEKRRHKRHHKRHRKSHHKRHHRR